MITIYYDEDDNEIDLPLKWEICDCCGGEGASSGHLGVLDHDEWDDDELSEYFSGAYDRSCGECGGTGKVKVPNLDLLSPDQRKLVEEQDRDRHEYAQIQASERRMGA